MNEISSVLDAIGARYWHISVMSAFIHDEDTPEQRALYDVQLTVLRDVAREVKRAMPGDADQGNGATVERHEWNLLVVEVGGQMTACVYGSAAKAEKAKTKLETELADLDAEDWRAEVCTVTAPARDRATFVSIDVRHVLIVYRDGAFWPTIHNTEIDLQEAIEDFEYLRSDPVNNNVEVFTHHRILIPHDQRNAPRSIIR